MAFYAADGEQLYVSGQTSTVDGEDQTYKGLGLSVVSLDDGEIERQTLVGQAAVDAPEEVIAPRRILAAAR